MKKIPTVFKRDPEDMSRVTDEVNPECQWVLDGEGIATRKYDGTCVMLDSGGGWWARREVKRDKPRPPNFVAVQADPVTGKTVGWEPIAQSPFAKFHAEALSSVRGLRKLLPVGTYELCGPKINGNPEGYHRHLLIAHDIAEAVEYGPATWNYDDLRDLLTDPAWIYEGIVWHHPDGRMAKLKGPRLPWRDNQEGRMTCPGLIVPSTIYDVDAAVRLTCEGTASQYHRSPAHPHLFCGCGNETVECHPGRCCRDDDWGQCVNCGKPAPDPEPPSEDELSDPLWTDPEEST